MRIETERLILRPWSVEDAEDLYAYAQDERVGPAAGWPPHRCIEESRDIIEDVFCSNSADHFAIQYRDDGHVIGSISLQGLDWRHAPKGAKEIGYCLNANYWGRGIMPEAVDAVLDYAFTSKKLKEVWCRHYDFNDKSRRVIEKSGFQYYATDITEVKLMNELRTDMIYCIKQSVWQRQHAKEA